MAPPDEDAPPDEEIEVADTFTITVAIFCVIVAEPPLVEMM